MKQLLFLAAFLIGFCLNSNAQPSGLDYRGKVGGRDTLTNAATDTTRFDVSGAKADFTIYVPMRKISGTVVGSVRYYYSIDGGSTYYLAETDNFADASGTFTFEKAWNPGYKWMVITQTTGTSVVSTEVWLQYRQIK